MGQVSLGGKAAATHDTPGNDSENDFDLIEPRTVLGNIDESNRMSWVTEESTSGLHRLEDAPLLCLSQHFVINLQFAGDHPDQLFATMGVEIVHDKHPAGIRVSRDRLSDVIGKIAIVAGLVNGRGDHLSLDYMPVASHANGAMTRVLAFDPGDLPGSCRPGFGATLVGLQAGHLVNANGVRVFKMIKPRCIEIGLTNRFDLRCEFLRIFFSGKTPVLVAVRLDRQFLRVGAHF